jgi:hypothetical protein
MVISGTLRTCVVQVDPQDYNQALFNTDLVPRPCQRPVNGDKLSDVSSLRSNGHCHLIISQVFKLSTRNYQILELPEKDQASV